MFACQHGKFLWTRFSLRPAHMASAKMGRLAVTGAKSRLHNQTGEHGRDESIAPKRRARRLAVSMAWIDISEKSIGTRIFRILGLFMPTP